MARDREKTEALAEGIYAWLGEHPVSTHDAISEGAQRGVSRWLDDNADELLKQLAGMVAASAESGDVTDARPAPPPLMTKSQKQQLLRAFAVACELAYRRGFQHGFVALEENPRLTGVKVAEWRSSPVKDHCAPPPGAGGHQPSILSRMLSEAREHGQVIREFIVAEPQIEIED